MFVSALLGAGVGLGIFLVLSDLRSAHSSAADDRQGPGRLAAGVREVLGHQRLVVSAVAAGVAMGVLTGWPVGGFLTTIAVLSMPQVVRPDRDAKARTARIEAIAVWAEMLRDTLSAAAGLEQAIRATADSPPPALVEEVRGLAARIESGQRTGDALRDFADDLDDPTADLVVVALILAAERQARQLAELLGSLADSAREQVVMRLKVDAERARVRTSVRVVMGVSLAMAAGLVLLNRGYLQPFDSAVGQFTLAIVGSLFGIAFGWMARIARLAKPRRLLTEAGVQGERVWQP
ncbi:type II secretion system F family protein [Embleya sp. NPDC055664]